jgi:hypothetical protein
VGLVVVVIIGLTLGVAPHASADPTIDGHDAYFNEDEYIEFKRRRIRCRPVNPAI